MFECSECGEENSKGSNYCWKCGSELKNLPAEKLNLSKKNKKFSEPAKILIIIAFSIAVVFSGSLAFYLGYNEGLDEAELEESKAAFNWEESIMFPRVVEDGTNEFLFRDLERGKILKMEAERKEDSLTFEKINFTAKNISDSQFKRLYIVLLKFPPTEGMIVNPYQRMIIKDVYPGETVSKRTFDYVAPNQRYEILVRVEFLE